MNSYEIVREACASVQPDILVNEHAQLIKFEGKVEYFKQYRPIRLADVLLAIRALEKIYATDDNGDFLRLDIAGRVVSYPAPANWNLRHDSLEWHRDNQPETVEWLAKLLGSDKSV
jgi:hypothetical protein